MFNHHQFKRQINNTNQKVKIKDETKKNNVADGRMGFMR